MEYSIRMGCKSYGIYPIDKENAIWYNEYVGRPAGRPVFCWGDLLLLAGRYSHTQHAAQTVRIHPYIIPGNAPIEYVGAIIVELWCDRHRRSTYFDSLRGAPRPAVHFNGFAETRCEPVTFMRAGAR